MRPRVTHALVPPTQHQVEEYVAWINSHLKKRTGTPLIYDLRSLQDGVTLVSLAEVLSKLILDSLTHDPCCEWHAACGSTWPGTRRPPLAAVPSLRLRKSYT